MKKLKIAYFGTPYFSARFLEKLLTDSSLEHLIEIKFVLTQNDKAVGRNNALTSSPVKDIARKFGLKVYDQNVQDLKNEIKKLDFVLIYAYGFKQYIPEDILSLPKIKFLNTNSGFINIHPSLLPLYRGASPITYPLILGDKKTGVTIFVLDKKMDHGPILAKEVVDILDTDKKTDLEIKLTDLGFQMFRKILKDSKSGVASLPSMTTTPQNHLSSTHARYLNKNDGFIELPTLKKALSNNRLSLKELPKIISEYIFKYKLIEKWEKKIENSPKIIFDYFQGMYPWPGLWTIIKVKGTNKRLKITDLSMNKGVLFINKVQLEGKKEVDYKTFNAAYGIF